MSRDRAAKPISETSAVAILGVSSRYSSQTGTRRPGESCSTPGTSSRAEIRATDSCDRISDIAFLDARSAASRKSFSFGYGSRAPHWMVKKKLALRTMPARMPAGSWEEPGRAGTEQVQERMRAPVGS